MEKHENFMEECSSLIQLQLLITQNCKIVVEKECEKLFNKSECKKLESQNVETYQVYSYRKKDKKFVPSRIIEVSKSFLK